MPIAIGATMQVRWPRCGQPPILMRMAGFQSIQAVMQSAMHNITAMLAMARRQPQIGIADTLNSKCC
ncbi:MAG TPA: hypothetical protein DDY43_07450 [Synechococcales bacterium UBA10510]|nr:hypothetical protein [Synechococcales bacterium UBA10510]